MKYLFYTTLLVASLGAVAAITNPPLIRQAATLIGLELSQDAPEPTKRVSREDQLSRFMAQAQYPQDFQNDSIIPIASVPAVVIPEPPQPLFAPIQAPSFPPFAPEPVVESITPAYGNAWDGSSRSIWDSPATTSIHSPSIHSPPQPFHELASAPQQSVYVVSPPAGGFSAVQDVPGFAQTRYVPPPNSFHNPQMDSAPPMGHPPGTLPWETSPWAAAPAPPVQVEHFPQQQATHAPIWEPLPQHQMQLHHQVPPQVEIVPVPGTETVARVGTQVILMGDVLPKLRRAARQMIAESISRMPEAERANVTPQEIERSINMFVQTHYPEALQEQILFALVYNDYLMAQDAAMRNHFNQRMSEEFNRVEIPEMMREFNVENIAALGRYLEENLGSSLEKERRLWVREQIVQEWMRMSIGRAAAGATQHEMLEFYERNQAMFTSAARARWQEMVVLFSNHNTENEAWDKMIWMGNQVVQGAPFEEIARHNSDGATASSGGVRDWITKGSLASAEVEQAIFSQPVGHLSPAIIRSDRGLHIIRVLEREEATVLPFVEAQVRISEQIRGQRTAQRQREYFADLNRRFPTEVTRDRIDFNDLNATPHRTASAW